MKTWRKGIRVPDAYRRAAENFGGLGDPRVLAVEGAALVRSGGKWVDCHGYNMVVCFENQARIDFLEYMANTRNMPEAEYDLAVL